MSRLLPGKLHTDFAHDTTPEGPISPRRYTLTHSDVTGDLFLTIGSAYNRSQISGWYTRLLRDEVLAEWIEGEDGFSLHVHCHVSGGIVLGPAGWRDTIFRRELPLVMEAFRFGDRQLFQVRPELDQAPVLVHFHAAQHRFNRVENWGKPTDYQLPAHQYTQGHEKK